MKAMLSVCLYSFFSLGFALANASPVNSTTIHIDMRFNQVANSSQVEHARIGSKICMKKLGCFEISPDFYDPLKRPINLLPRDRASISTKFVLYTKLHPMEAHYLDADDPEDIKDSSINPSHRTIFIVHGFFDSTLYGKWMEVLKTNILLHGDYNVIIVDWSKGNGAPYTQATANTRVVGAEIALLIQTLEKFVGISPMDCHIIGHSLGSHIAGYAGERLKVKKLGRITALDPAQPFFQDMPPSVRIDPTDADFVDVIHTDSSSSKFLALGMSQAVGHVDFFPNNGMSQPGCSYSSIYSVFLEGLVDAVRQFVSCNHQRAVEYFIYSLNFKKVLPVSHQCTSWNDYRYGRCSDCGRNGEKCAVMGMKAEQFKKFKNDSESIKMYLTTSASAPFWVFNYQISIKLARPAKVQDKSGDINLVLHGSKNDYDISLSTQSGQLVHGATYSFFVSKEEELGVLKSLSFKWNSKSWMPFVTHVIYLDFAKVTPMNIIDKVEREANTKKFCYQPTKAIKSKQIVLLTECT